MTVTRRRAMEFFGAGAFLALTGCRASEEAADGTSSALGESTEVTAQSVAPVELQADVADLKLNLWAAPATATIAGGLISDVWSFGAEVVEGDPASVAPSGSYLGPTLHLRTGQRVRVSFENRLEEPSIVHWHGLVVPQDQDGQPADKVGPGEVYEYDFVVTNSPGTYWYHPHPHERTGEQVYRGLAGLLVIHGDEPDLPSGDNDLSLVLQDRTVDAEGQLHYITTMHDTMAGFVGGTLVTNGVADLAISVRREPYRVRILNGANSRTQYLTLSNGAAMTVVATDGSLLPEATTVPGLVITPAQRSDLWLDFSGFEPGDTVELRTATVFVESMGGMGGGMGEGGGMMGDGMGDDEEEMTHDDATMGSQELSLDSEVAATFVIADSEARPGEAPTKLGSVPDFGPEDAVNRDNPKVMVLSTRQMSHQLNGRLWEGRSVTELETVGAGTVEIWDFVSESPLPHPMHLHGNAFRVIDRSWDDDSAAADWDQIAGGIVESGLRDTVLVFPGQRVRIAIPFAEHLGYFMYHCHILEHEDAGMMRNFLVT